MTCWGCATNERKTFCYIFEKSLIWKIRLSTDRWKFQVLLFLLELFQFIFSYDTTRRTYRHLHEWDYVSMVHIFCSSLHSDCELHIFTNFLSIATCFSKSGTIESCSLIAVFLFSSCIISLVLGDKIQSCRSTYCHDIFCGETGKIKILKTMKT